MPHLEQRKLLLAVAFFLMYAIGRGLLTTVWYGIPAAEITLSFLVLLPLLYSAFAFYEIGGVAAALATIGMNLILRSVFDRESGLDPQVLWSTWAAAVGIGGLVGYIVRINAQLTQRTKRLELTTREANHRIKNSLNLAASVVGIESEADSDPRVARLLGKISGRIGAIADLHDILAWNGADGRVNLNDYVLALAERIQRSAPLAIRVRSTLADETTTSSDQATCLGMICNELLLNVAEHDRSDNGTPIATIEMSAGDSVVQLAVSSDRGAMPTDVPAGTGRGRGMGTVLIEAFVAQLNAELAVIRRSPPAFSVRFPLEDE